ncbi:MAG: hypothetical protein WCQ26_01285 [Pseudanabaena sp. ELA748]
MALVLFLQENITLLLLLGGLALGMGTIAIAFLIFFWLRLKKIEKRLYFKPKQIKSRLAPKTFTQTQVYRQGSSQSPLKRAPKRARNSRWQWFLAIAIACITGTAIALLQLGNGLLSPEYTAFIWLCIGLGLVVSAAYIL